jgi:hypothetical protein
MDTDWESTFPLLTVYALEHIEALSDTLESSSTLSPILAARRRPFINKDSCSVRVALLRNFVVGWCVGLIAVQRWSNHFVIIHGGLT